MRLLADLCIARLTIEGLRADGHDVLSLVEAKLNPTDEDILAKAFAEARVLLTEDADFGTQIAPADQLDIIRRVIALHAPSLARGAVVSARRGRIRVTEKW